MIGRLTSWSSSIDSFALWCICGNELDAVVFFPDLGTFYACRLPIALTWRLLLVRLSSLLSSSRCPFSVTGSRWRWLLRGHSLWDPKLTSACLCIETEWGTPRCCSRPCPLVGSSISGFKVPLDSGTSSSISPSLLCLLYSFLYISYFKLIMMYFGAFSYM